MLSLSPAATMMLHCTQALQSKQNASARSPNSAAGSTNPGLEIESEMKARHLSQPRRRRANLPIAEEATHPPRRIHASTSSPRLACGSLRRALPQLFSQSFFERSSIDVLSPIEPLKGACMHTEHPTRPPAGLAPSIAGKEQRTDGLLSKPAKHCKALMQPQIPQGSTKALPCYH